MVGTLTDKVGNFSKSAGSEMPSLNGEGLFCILQALMHLKDGISSVLPTAIEKLPLLKHLQFILTTYY